MTILEFAAKDNETAQQDPAPIPHVLGMVTGVAKVEWDEATDIQQDLEEVYKPIGYHHFKRSVGIGNNKYYFALSIRYTL